MLLQSCLLVSSVVLQIVTSAPLQDEKIQPVDLNYLCIEAETNGNEQRKSPILLIHGLSSSLSNWNGVNQVLALRTGRRVCAVDLRNHGGSPWSNQSDVPVMTADIANFLDKEKIGQVNIIGHSLGGKIAVHYALNYPQRVDSLVVEDMRPNGITDTALQFVKLFLQYLQAAIKSVPDGSTEAEAGKIILKYIVEKLKEIGLEDEIDENAALLIPVRCTDGKCRYNFNIDLLATIANEDIPLIDSTGVYKGKALFIYGQRSPFAVFEDRKNILKLFPNAKLFGVKRAGHVIHGKYREFEDEVIKLLNN